MLKVYLHMLSWGRQNDETVQRREKESLGKRQREERGRPLREVQPVENLQACQFQLVHSGLWTQHFYFPHPLRERQMFCLSALQLKLFPSVHDLSRCPSGQISPPKA